MGGLSLGSRIPASLDHCRSESQSRVPPEFGQIPDFGSLQILLDSRCTRISRFTCSIQSSHFTLSLLECVSGDGPRHVPQGRGRRRPLLFAKGAGGRHLSTDALRKPSFDSSSTQFVIFRAFMMSSCGFSAPSEAILRFSSFVDMVNSTGALLFCKTLNQAFIPGINPAGHNVPSCLDISGFSLLLFEKGFGSV